MKAMVDPEQVARTRRLARLGPIVVVVAVLGLATAVVLTTDPATTDAADPSVPVSVPPDQVELPPGVLPFFVAEAEGRVDEIDWGARCDVDEGVLAMPLSPPPGCFAPYTGPPGGATETGVTDDTIRVVVYLPQENDPILSFIYEQIGNDDTPTDSFRTYEGYAELLGAYYETYGRTVEMVRYDATGPINDSVAATTDAETIARDLQPFVVLGGPQLSSAFAETLAANEIMCISCAPAQTTEWYEERAPYIWDVLKSAEQTRQMVAEYVGKRLAGRPAAFGGEEVRDQTRRFGLIYAEGPASDELRDGLEQNLAEYDVELTEIASFADPLSLAGQAREMLTKMRDRGVTSILYAGDPLGPQALTRAATDQGYFPEWVLSGSGLVDTSLFARTYDQAQWRHAFGPSNLFARLAPSLGGGSDLYRWYFGEQPPANTNAPLILPNLQLLFGVLQGAGPELSHEMFRNVLFGTTIIEGSVIAPQLSWGDRGIFPGVDYSGIDDGTEIWWDPEAEGIDETGQEATGLWAYANGGRRYLPGEWPETPPDVFDRSNSVTRFTELPPGISVPDYEPLPRS